MATTGEIDVSVAAGMFADRSRSRVIRALMDGRALPASRLAEEAAVSPATVSSHLAKLLDAGFVTVQRSGRHRYYSLADAHVAEAFEALSVISRAEPVRSLREGTRAERLRTARTCYDHLAGRLGVQVTETLLDREVLVRTDDAAGLCRRHEDAYSAPVRSQPYALGPGARCGLAEWGVDVDAITATRRTTLKFCTDWTEQCHHLAGGLGSAVLAAFRANGWVADGPRPRELVVTEAGKLALTG
ncbi:MAG: ArsR/SmtB family transcription factor [Marmoricola sp.]